MEGADRISALPLDIVISILSRLRVKEAVRTSAVARSWRHLWTLLPCLRLSSSRDRLGAYTLGSLPVPSNLIERVHHLVSSLRGPLLVFQLCDMFLSDQSALLQSVLDLLLQKGLAETLILSSIYEQVALHLPFFHSLKELQLCKCHVILPSGFPGFKHLITLSMQLVQISNGDLHLLIYTSNNLTTLRNFDCASSGDPLSVNINLPMLKHLEFGINRYVEKVCVVSAPCLEQASITSGDFYLEKLAKVTLELMTSIVMVSSLKLDYDVLTSLSRVALPLNFTIPRLRRLKLILNFDAMDKRMYVVFHWLLKSMPFLQELELVVIFSFFPNYLYYTLLDLF